jgi:hypothetical protein
VVDRLVEKMPELLVSQSSPARAFVVEPFRTSPAREKKNSCLPSLLELLVHVFPLLHVADRIMMMLRWAAWTHSLSDATLVHLFAVQPPTVVMIEYA